MKFTLVSIALSLSFGLISSAAMACPNLTGTYLCAGDAKKGTVDTTISVMQEVRFGGVTNYSFITTDANSSEIYSVIADGVTRKRFMDFTDENGNKLGVTRTELTATCGSTKLNVLDSYKIILDNSDKLFASGEANIDVSKVGDSLLTTVTDVMTFPDGKVERVVSQEVCTAQK